MIAPAASLRHTRGTLELGGTRPLLMGVINATPDSFSDAGLPQTLKARTKLAQALLEAGADLIDIGGESGVTNRPAIGADEEIERVAPLIERVSGELGALVSVDTYKSEVASAAIAAGAAIVNDPSGLIDPAIAEVCAHTNAGLVIAHTRARPKQKLLDRSFDDTILADVEKFFSERIAEATSRGVDFAQLLLDPGPDLGKTPYQTIEVLKGLPRLHALGRPLLLAASRKDFIGALTDRPPRARLAGTLAAIAHGLDAGVHVLRVHDVSEASDFIIVRGVLKGELEVEPGLTLGDQLRWAQGPPTEARLP